MITRTYIGEAQAIDLLVSAVEEKGREYIDPHADAVDGCVYRNDDGTPGCIVGHVFYELGILDEIVDGERASRAPGTSETGNNDVQVKLLDNFLTGPGVDLLEIAQGVQDVGATWGTAITAVHKYVAGEPVEEP
jgi:hypothetical protein